jgi:hypothetical protein
MAGDGFVPLRGDASSEVFGVPQWESLSGLAESVTIPSLLYLPVDVAVAQLLGKEAGKGEWIVVGRL